MAHSDDQRCDCFGPRFSVTAGTPMHSTHLPIGTWIIAIYFIATSSKGISSLKLASLLGLQYRTTWHLTHRIRAMMDRNPDLLRDIVELDETSMGGKPRAANKPEPPAPMPLFEDPKPEPEPQQKPKKRRKTGRGTDEPMAFTAVARGGEARAIGRQHAGPITVNHSAGEFVRDDARTGLPAHCNPAESVDALFQRAIVGVFHWISGKHRDRYLREVAFRWNHRGPIEGRLTSRFATKAGPLPLKALVA